MSLLLLGNLADAKTVGDALEISRRNLKGHASLYNEGWFIVTSTKDAIQSSRMDSMGASQAMNAAIKEAKGEKPEFIKNVSDISVDSKQSSEEFLRNGSERTRSVFAKTGELWTSQWKFSKETYAGAYSAVTLGYLEFGERNQEDWEKLKKADRDFVHRTAHPLADSEMQLLITELYKEGEKKSDEAVWSKVFTKAGEEFNSSYEDSGEKGNSLLALGSVMWGHIKAIYYGFMKPSAVTVADGTVASVDLSKKAGAYLAGGIIATAKITGDIIYTTGLNLYYSTKIGYHVFSPTLEGGFLGAIAIATTATMPVVAASGASLGVLNQVAVTSATPIVGTGQFVIASTAETAKFCALTTYDFAKGTGEAALNEAHAGIVLGYNMLTQIPAQTLLGVANATVFLLIDGPHLVLVALRGEIDGVPISQVPVGTVLDAKSLEAKGITSEKITDDPNVIQKVLEAAPKDLQNTSVGAP